MSFKNFILNKFLRMIKNDIWFWLQELLCNFIRYSKENETLCRNAMLYACMPIKKNNKKQQKTCVFNESNDLKTLFWCQF